MHSRRRLVRDDLILDRQPLELFFVATLALSGEIVRTDAILHAGERRYCGGIAPSHPHEMPTERRAIRSRPFARRRFEQRRAELRISEQALRLSAVESREVIPFFESIPGNGRSRTLSQCHERRFRTPVRFGFALL